MITDDLTGFAEAIISSDAEVVAKKKDVNGSIDIAELDLSEEMKKKVILAQINLLSRSRPEDKEFAEIRATSFQHAALFVGKIMGETLVKLSLRTGCDGIYTICDVNSVSVDPATGQRLQESIQKACEEGYVSVSLKSYLM